MSIRSSNWAVAQLMLVVGLLLVPVASTADGPGSALADQSATAGGFGGSSVSVWSGSSVQSSRAGAGTYAGTAPVQSANPYLLQDGKEVTTLAAYVPTTPKPTPKTSAKSARPDLVLVEKSAKKLLLMKSGQILREYPIALGKNPVGHKTEKGDGRTPEGRYTLDWRNPASKFYRSIHISYPNAQDVEQARARNKHPGEYIMIHGSPAWVPSVEWAKNWLHKENWTEGCIAVTNDIMDEIWNMVADGTPIEIRP